MDSSDYMEFRMICCSECRKVGDDISDDWRCRASPNDIDNCIDATAPIYDNDGWY